MRLVVTAGPTREHLDDVRFLSNASSGRMGYAVARAAARRGHRVTLISGPVALKAPPGVRLVPVVTARELERAVSLALAGPGVRALVMAAAVCDFRPRRRLAGKQKKAALPAALALAPNPDILAGLGRKKGKKILVGFALEAGRDRAEARRKLKAKRLDLILLNTTRALGAGRCALDALWPDGRAERWGPAGKAALGARIVKAVEALAGESG